MLCHQILRNIQLNWKKDSLEQSRSSCFDNKKNAGLQGWKWITVHQIWFRDRRSRNQNCYSGGILRSFFFFLGGGEGVEGERNESLQRCLQRCLRNLNVFVEKVCRKWWLVEIYFSDDDIVLRARRDMIKTITTRGSITCIHEALAAFPPPPPEKKKQYPSPRACSQAMLSQWFIFCCVHHLAILSFYLKIIKRASKLPAAGIIIKNTIFHPGHYPKDNCF